MLYPITENNCTLLYQLWMRTSDMSQALILPVVIWPWGSNSSGGIVDLNNGVISQISRYIPSASTSEGVEHQVRAAYLPS